MADRAQRRVTTIYYTWNFEICRFCKFYCLFCFICVSDYFFESVRGNEVL